MLVKGRQMLCTDETTRYGRDALDSTETPILADSEIHHADDLRPFVVQPRTRARRMQRHNHMVLVFKIIRTNPAFNLEVCMDPAEFSSFRRTLVAWYAKHARDLPWRQTTDPYRIWISEIMLQQTTVAAVIPYFERFLAEFPTVLDLASAQETAVLRLWEGLGYYSRARNLHRAAKVLVERHSGAFPHDLASLRELPGIGRYTAGAIFSFAFDRPAPIVEANTLRLYCRLLGYPGDPRSKQGQAILWSFAETILPKKHPGRLNQALMELGATVCSPRDPQCESCPVNRHCQSFHDGTQATIPQAKSKTVITEITEASIAIQNGSKYLLRRRTSVERWAGLWDFVRFEIEHQAKRIDRENLVASVKERTGLDVELGPQVVELKHGVTRYRITLKCFIANERHGQLLKHEEWKWVLSNQLDQYPLSVTARQFAKRLQQRSSAEFH
jgi:A/G-specific adenine glycosylase